MNFHKRYTTLFQELTRPRYHVFTMDEYYHQGQRDSNAIQVVLRFDVDAGAGIAYEVADHLHRLGLHASFFFLTRTATYTLDWDRLRELQAHGFEVGLHSDHYYEQLAQNADGLGLIKEDAATFSRELSGPVGMVWHGHAAINQMKRCNWDLYKYVGAADLGLRYHDGVDGPYSFANAATWGPPADISFSDGMQQFLVLWRRYLRILRRARPGSTVHILLHPQRAVDWWKVTLSGESLPPAMTPLDRARLYVKHGLMGALRSGWRLATRALARGLARTLYQLGRTVIRERKPRSELLDAASVQAHIELMSQKPVSVWEDKLKDLGFIGMDVAVDVGAGPGRYSIALANLNKRVIAVEPLKEFRHSLVDRAKKAKATNIDVLPNRAEDMDEITAESVNGVYCNAVLLMVDADAVLDEFSRISRPGAVLYVSVAGFGDRLLKLSESVKTGNFHLFNVHFRAIWNTSWKSYVARSNYSVTYFTHRRLRKLLTRHGFEVVKLIPDQYFWDDEPTSVAGFANFFGALAIRR